MESLVAGLVAIVGTLVGAITTYLLQRRMFAERAAVERGDRLRAEQLAACGAYAGALTDVKRAAVAVWLQRQATPDDDRTRTAWVDADRAGAAAEAARLRLLLVMPDRDLAQLADHAFDSVQGIVDASDRDELSEAERLFAAALAAFISHGAHLLRGSGAPQ